MRVEIELPEEITLDYAHDKFRDFFRELLRMWIVPDVAERMKKKLQKQ